MTSIMHIASIITKSITARANDNKSNTMSEFKTLKAHTAKILKLGFSLVIIEL
jgi:hypothetical protein